MSSLKTFPYKGRIIISSPTADGKNTIVGYKADPTEVARIKNQWGPVTVNEDLGIVNLFVYINNDKNNRQDFGSSVDLTEYQGITNEVLTSNAVNDPNFYRQVTGNTTPNTQTTPEGEPDQGSSVPTTSPNKTPVRSIPDRLQYPLLMRDDQDKIRFTAVKYQPSGNLESGTISNRDRKTTTNKELLGSVFLPIQASITDANSVDWQGAGLNELERYAANAALAGMTMDLDKIPEAATKEAMNIFKYTLPKYQNQARVYLAQEATGIQNLLGRFGTILNPNLELLFSGPQLRPFEFRFQMTAREPLEAIAIKKIIHFFKKNMAAKTTDDGIFLKAPNTFFIEYLKGLSPHKSINQIKECALTNCSVDYTPLGTYMTFDDEEATMVSYSISLSFQELEPVYEKDYNDKEHPIGY